MESINDNFCHNNIIIWNQTTPLGLHLQSSIALSHSSLFESPWLAMGLVILLIIHRHFYVELQPCGGHHTQRIEVIEHSMSASPEQESMHAISYHFSSGSLVRLSINCWAIFLQLPGNSTALPALAIAIPVQ